MFKKILAFALAVSFISFAVPAASASENMVLETNKGQVVIRLRADFAPKHVERIKTLTQEGFYNGVPFHRVIEGFMAQTGDPTGTGTGKSSYPDLAQEFTQTPFVRGTVGMARGATRDSANSQFFICFEPSSWLDGQYTVIGEVIEGMSVVDSLKKGAQGSGTVSNPDKVVKATLVSR